jgi:Metallo-peptidase family M12/IPT/TIG domain
MQARISHRPVSVLRLSRDAALPPSRRLMIGGLLALLGLLAPLASSSGAFASALPAARGAAAAPDLASALSAALPIARAAGPGQRVEAPDLASPAELVRFDEQMLPVLLQVRPDATLRISGWPVAPEVRKDVVVTRHEIYAPDARILEAKDGAMVELPRSRLVFFWGTEADDPESGVFLALDPDKGTIEGLAQAAGVTHQVRPLVPGKPGLHLVARAEAFLAAAGPKPSWSCGEETLPPFLSEGLMAPSGPAAPAGAFRDPSGAVRAQTASGTLPPPATVTSGLNLATVAIDTDHDLMAQKFNDDTTAATNYLASLFAAINVMYERDLQVRLLEGTTILRTAAVADPYVQQSSGYATGQQLSEFSSYWASNYGGVSRAVAAMLSGKSPYSNSASGIAWVQGLCNNSYGYSFSQVFKIDYLAGDALIVGHEIGHNFGSRHTHCYSPPIDNCYANESGCYSGATSCPAPATINGVANVQGTIMSYCHLLGGCSSAMVFHPRTVALINPIVAGASCISSSGGAPPGIASVAPNDGPGAGGTQVTIGGSNLTSDATVTIGGVAATVTNVAADGRSVTAVTGAHASGTVDVVVTTANGSATLSNSFFYGPSSTGLGFYTVTPCRVLDTRSANAPALAAYQQRLFKVAATCGIPSSAVYISTNVTVVAYAAGNITLYPGNAFPLGTSTINFAANRTRANNAIVLLATDGTGTIGVQNSSSGSNSFILDVNGYFQ